MNRTMYASVLLSMHVSRTNGQTVTEDDLVVHVTSYAFHPMKNCMTDLGIYA